MSNTSNKDLVNTIAETMVLTLEDEGISNLCFSTALILNEFYVSMDIDSKLVIGYIIIGGTISLRHVWCVVNGMIIDASTPKSMKGMIEYSKDHRGELLTGDTSEEIKTYKNLEESLSRYKRGIPLNKCLTPKGMKVYNSVREKFNILATRVVNKK